MVKKDQETRHMPCSLKEIDREVKNDSFVKEEAIHIQAENEYMQIAIQQAVQGITHGHGGPFGSVVVKDGVVVGLGHNQVLLNHDPTCHGEISAIRDAGKRLGTHDLSGCVLFTTGEPCPMCLFACKWANIDRVYYGCTIEDNERMGFRDKELDGLLRSRAALGEYLICIDREACLKLFDTYLLMERTNY